MSKMPNRFVIETEPPVEERERLGKWLWSVVAVVAVLVVATLIALPVYVLTSGRFATIDSKAAIIGAAAAWFAASLTAIAAFVALLAYKSGERRPKLALVHQESPAGLEIWLENRGHASAHRPILICELDDFVYKGLTFEKWYRVPFHRARAGDRSDWLWTRMVWVRDISIHPGISQGVETLPMGAVQDPRSGLAIAEPRDVHAQFRWTCDGGVLTKQSMTLRFAPVSGNASETPPS